MIAGLVTRLSGYIYEGLQISMGGLVLGLLAYILSVLYVVRFWITARHQRHATKLALARAGGLLIFMYLAPETIREALL